MSDEIKYMYLKGHPLFSSLSDEKIKDACLLGKVKSIIRGESFGYGEGSYSRIFLLIKGKLKITVYNETDHEMIKDILTAPDIFGDLGMEGRILQDEYAEGLTNNTIVCSFKVSDFKRYLQDNPMMAFTYANTMNAKLMKLEGRHSDLVFRDAKSRLLRFIKNWASADGCRVGDEIILNNYLTHTDIANVIATSRQNVNVLFNELRDAGLLLYNRKQIELNNPVSWN
jgi:CRP/FNR family transcriptional regulator